MFIPQRSGTNKWVEVLGCKADNLPRLSTREAPVVKRVGWLPTSVAVLDRAVAIGKVDDGIGQGTVRVGHGRLSTFGEHYLFGLVNTYQSSQYRLERLPVSFHLLLGHGQPLVSAT